MVNRGGYRHGQRLPLCVVCGERPARSARGEHPTCGSCASTICRLGQLSDEQSRIVERQAVTRVRRILAARLGLARFVERMQQKRMNAAQQL